MPVARHLSIAWGVTLAVLALLEWNSLEREPLREPLLSPFIERSVTLTPAAANGPSTSAGGEQTVVELRFNGPLFLIWFFGPVILFNGCGMAFEKLRGER